MLYVVCKFVVSVCPVGSVTYSMGEKEREVRGERREKKSLVNMIAPISSIVAVNGPRFDRECGATLAQPPTEDIVTDITITTESEREYEK